MNRSELLSIAKPILFNTEMVQAILAGIKGVTRRLPSKRIMEKWSDYNDWANDMCAGLAAGGSGVSGVKLTEREFYEQYPPYRVGDILYVRETWQYIDFAGEENGYVYKASENGKTWEENSEGWKWKPSIHMPKEAARIFLRITDIRMERLQDITPEQIEAEGCREYGYNMETGELTPSKPTYFKIVWNKTVPKEELAVCGWDSNPWVWVIEFERIEVS